MNCQKSYCIYNKNSKCVLDSIGIDELGMCEECIIVSLSDDMLEQEKARHLNDLEAIYESWRLTDQKPLP